MTKKKWTTTFNYGAISLILCGKAETSKNSEAKGSYSYEQGKSRVCLLNANDGNCKNYKSHKQGSKVLNNKNGSDGKCSQCARF